MTYKDLPANATGFVTDAITDALGVGMAGSREESALALLRVLPTSKVSNGVALLGTELTASESDAALYNGTAIHALDYDDTTHPAYSHPSSHLVPVLLSLASQNSLSGQDLLTAYVLGLEVEGKLARTLNMGHYLHGWHTTGTLGTLAATVAAAKLLSLDDYSTSTALGIATSLASGIRANFGTMTKPLHAGLAARNGVMAARLAQVGFTASHNALEGKFGFFEVFGTKIPDTSSWSELGRPWEITDPYGLALKPYPSCGATHPAIEAALRAWKDIDGRNITSVEVGTNNFSEQILIYKTPTKPLEGKFSMHYCVAAALVNGRIGLDTFTQDAITDPVVLDLLARIHVYVADEVRDNPEFGAVISVTGNDGLMTQHMVPLAKGKPARWLSKAELREKFLDCTEGVVGMERGISNFASIQELPCRSDAGYLGEMCRI